MKAGKEEGAGGGGGKNSKERNSRRTRVGGRRERRGASFSFSRTTWGEDRGSVGSKDENVNRLRLFSSPLLSTPLPDHRAHSSPSAAERILKPRDTEPWGRASWSLLWNLREITMRGPESGAKRKFPWKRMRDSTRRGIEGTLAWRERFGKSRVNVRRSERR